MNLRYHTHTFPLHFFTHIDTQMHPTTPIYRLILHINKYIHCHTQSQTSIFICSQINIQAFTHPKPCPEHIAFTFTHTSKPTFILTDIFIHTRVHSHIGS